MYSDIDRPLTRNTASNDENENKNAAISKARIQLISNQVYKIDDPDALNLKENSVRMTICVVKIATIRTCSILETIMYKYNL